MMGTVPAPLRELARVARVRAEVLLQSHRRVLQTARLGVRGFRVQPWLAESGAPHASCLS